MHIPDSVLSPATTLIAGVAMIPIWTIAARRVRKSLGTRQTPLLALGAGFCFTIMMFNIPALGGTTAHPVAGTMLAVLLGPWAACIGISAALAIQALFFGDGGLLAYGANCFTMAFVLPFVGYSVYRLLMRLQRDNSARTPLCAAVGSFAGINAAAAVVAVLLGIQPTLFHEANGHALFFPFGMNITLPAMLGTHLIIAGPAEAIVTGIVIRALQSMQIPLYGQSAVDENSPGIPLNKPLFRREALWVGLLAIVALTPLGLIAKGDAWGEWDASKLKSEIKKVQGDEYVPKEIARGEAKNFKGIHGLEDYASGDGKNRVGYIGAGALGVSSISILLLGGSRLLIRKKQSINAITEDHVASQQIEHHRINAPSTSNLPEWLKVPVTDSISTQSSKVSSNRFLERTLSELSAGISKAFLLEHFAKESGLLQRLDPRAKLLGFLALIFITSSIHSFLILFWIYMIALLLVFQSNLSISMLSKRVWLTVPLFVGALAMPAVLNIVTPGHEILQIWKHPHLALTQPGLIIATMFTCRVGVAVTLATMLTMTTPWNDLLRALRLLCVPRFFVSVLAMTYRYIAVLLLAASDMFVARKSRTVGAASNSQGRNFIGAGMGALFGKTLAFSEEVHSAMLSRGFTGEMISLSTPCWQNRDSLWLSAVLLISIVSIWHG